MDRIDVAIIRIFLKTMMFTKSILTGARRVAALQATRPLLVARQISTTSMLCEREVGTLKWFNRKKAYGFIIRPEDQGDVFVHSNCFRDDVYHLKLDDGTEMEYDVQKTEKGLVAQDVITRDGDNF